MEWCDSSPAATPSTPWLKRHPRGAWPLTAPMKSCPLVREDRAGLPPPSASATAAVGPPPWPLPPGSTTGILPRGWARPQTLRPLQRLLLPFPLPHPLQRLHLLHLLLLPQVAMVEESGWGRCRSWRRGRWGMLPWALRRIRIQQTRPCGVSSRSTPITLCRLRLRPQTLFCNLPQCRLVADQITEDIRAGNPANESFAR
jgi:hypothetical protein